MRPFRSGQSSNRQLPLQPPKSGNRNPLASESLSNNDMSIREIMQKVDSFVIELRELAKRVSKLENANAIGMPQEVKLTTTKTATKVETSAEAKETPGVSKTSTQTNLSEKEGKQQKRRPRRKKQKTNPDESIRPIPTLVPQKTAKTSDSNQGLTSLNKIFDEMQDNESQITEHRLKKDKSLTEAIALDCEMVGAGPRGRYEMLARVSAVNMQGKVLYDEYVLPKEPVTDYRTRISGIRPEHLERGVTLSVARRKIAAIIKNRIVVGHALHHDFRVLSLYHPKRLSRDTSDYKTYRDLFGGQTPSLKNLANRVLNLKIQEGEHSSVQDAQVAMKLYLHQRQQWEDELKRCSG